MGAILPLGILAIGAILVIIVTWLRPILELRQSPAEQRAQVLKEQLNIYVKRPADPLEPFALRRWNFKKKSLFYFPAPDNSDGLMRIAGELNYWIFRNTAFGDSLDTKIARNTGHQRKNPNVLMLLAHPNQDTEENTKVPMQWIGFTHLIPVNQHTYNAYLSKKINDNDFDASYVCPSDEPAYAVIVFSIGMDRYKIKALHSEEIKLKKKRSWKEAYQNFSQPSSLFLEADKFLRDGLVFHLRHIIENQKWETRTAKVVTQSLNRKVVNVLLAADFKPLPDDMRTADNEPTFELELSTKTQ